MMVMLVLSVCPPSLRGDVTKWLFQVETGVFVGRVTTRVRDLLWNRIERSVGDGHAVMISNSTNEQRFDIRVHNSNMVPIDYDGITLLMTPSS